MVGPNWPAPLAMGLVGPPGRYEHDSGSIANSPPGEYCVHGSGKSAAARVPATASACAVSSTGLVSETVVGATLVIAVVLSGTVATVGIDVDAVAVVDVASVVAAWVATGT